MLTETRLRIPFSVIGRCYLMPTSYWLQGKCAGIYLSQAASGMILQNRRWFPAALGSLKRVTADSQNLKVISKEQAKTSRLFFYQLRNKKI
jgi:hypothetical protein